MATAEREPSRAHPGPAGDGPAAYPWRTSPPPHAAAPDRPSVQGRRAGLVTRTLANALDAGVVGLLLAAGYTVVTFLRYVISPFDFQFPAPSLGLVLLLGAAVEFVYLAVAWGTDGRTYGDVILGLRVVDGRGRRVRWLTAVLRAGFCVVFPVGLLWVLVSAENRSVQDVALRTSVVHDWPGRPD